MNPFAQGNSGGGGSTSINPFATNTSQSGSLDLNSSQGLLNLALEQGGAVGQVASELVHPTTGILSTIGNGFKKAFSGFVDMISVPNQVIAGIISDKYSVSDAIKKNISTSDVIFGDQDKNSTTMQKVGGFLVRTATDIVLDPLTYLTFGASKGVLGLSSLQKVSLGEKAAATLGKEAFSTAALSEDIGTSIYRALSAQASGSAKAAELMAKAKGVAPGIMELAGKELETVLAHSIDAPLNMDFAKKALTNLLESQPALAETILDKGGIKFFGKTILSGQRISAGLRMIPGMTLIDEATKPFRLAIQAPFNPAIIKDAQTGKYVRLPEEFVQARQMASKLAAMRTDGAYQNLDAIVRGNKLTVDEAKLLSDSLLAGTMPADARLANAYTQALNFSENELKWLQESGVPVARRDNFGMPLVRTDLQDVKFNPGVASTAKKGQATFERTTGKFVNPLTGESLVGSPESLNLIKKNTAEEIQRITIAAEKNIEAKGLKIDSITTEMEKLNVYVGEAYQGKVTAEFEKVLQSIPEGVDRENARQFINVLKDQMGQLNVENLTKGFAQQTMEAGVKIEKAVTEGLDKMSPEALQALKTKLMNGELQLPIDIQRVNEALKAAEPNINKTAAKVAGSVEDEIANLAKKLRMESSAKRFSEIGKNIDNEALIKFTNAIQQQFEANPTGVRKILNQLIGDKQQVMDLVNEIDLERTIAKQNISELPNAKLFFTDKEGKVYERFNATMSELKEAGFNFEDNAIIANAIRATDNAKVGSTRRFIREAAENFARPASEAPTGWRKINVGNVEGESEKILQLLGKEGEEMYFHPLIAQELEKSVKSVITDDATNDFLKVYDKIQSLWKAGVTSIFPAFHGRNALSNVFQNFMDIGLHSVNPANHAAATQMVFYDKNAAKLERLAYSSDVAIAQKAKDGLTELLNRNVFTDVTGHAWSFGEIRQVLKEKGIAFMGGTGQIDVSTAKSLGDATTALFPESRTLAQKGKNIAKLALPTTQDFAPFAAGRLVGSMVEDQAKVLNFMVNLRATGDVSHAAARTAMFLFDYGNLTGFEKTFLKRLIPFYTFTRKNLELQVKTLLSTPGRISTEVHALTNLGEAISGAKLSQEEYDALPDWIKSGIGILKSKKGSTVEIYGSLGTPLEQPFAAFQPNQFLGSVSPLIRLPIETATGYSWFQGKPLSDVTNAAGFKRAPQAVKDFIGYKELHGKRKDGTEFTWYVSLSPERMNIINNLPLAGRVISSIKQMDSVDVSSQSKILQQLVGVRPYSFDVEQEKARRELELQNELKDLLTKAGITGQFTRTYIPKASNSK